MMTRREVLIQLKKAGVKEFSLLKYHCRDFENFMATHHDWEIGRRGKTIKPLPFIPPKPVGLIN
jgi:hypothetical protein